MSAKHLYVGKLAFASIKTEWLTACGRWWFEGDERITSDPDSVSCETCRTSRIYQIRAPEMRTPHPVPTDTEERET